MIVWVEGVQDGGSAVWCCTACAHGGWCADRDDATTEALAHALGHGIISITVVSRQHGPKPDESRDEKVNRLRRQGKSIRAIAELVGLSTAGVLKALKRTKEPA